MQCPVCKAVSLVAHDLEADLVTRQCPECHGNWLPSYQYWKWREHHGADLPEIPADPRNAPRVTESAQPKICPECGHILLPYHIGHGLAFSLDRCGHCAGIWFEANEWEVLKSRNLHDDVHFIFSQPWQADVFKSERREARERLWQERLGADDLAEIRRVKTWLDGHPHRHELYAFLLHPENG